MGANKGHYHVLRDVQEKPNQGWVFPPSDRCDGTSIIHLKTGDYTLRGFEDKFIIERKRNTGELAQNLFQPRFERELTRLDSFEFPYLFLEFTFEDVVLFPENSGVPEKLWGKLRMSPQALMMKIHQLQLSHPKIQIWMVGNRGRETASSLFKRIVEHYGR